MKTELYFDEFSIEPSRAMSNVGELLEVDSQTVWFAFFGSYHTPVFVCETEDEAHARVQDFQRAGVRLAAASDPERNEVAAFDWGRYYLSHSPFLRELMRGGPSVAQIAWWQRLFPLEMLRSVATVFDGSDFEVLLLVGDPVFREQLVTFIIACCGIADEEARRAILQCVEDDTVLSLPRSLNSGGGFDYLTACFVASTAVTMQQAAVIKRHGEPLNLGFAVTRDVVIRQVTEGLLLTNDGHLATRLWWEYMGL